MKYGPQRNWRLIANNDSNAQLKDGRPAIKDGRPRVNANPYRPNICTVHYAAKYSASQLFERPVYMQPPLFYSIVVIAINHCFSVVSPKRNNLCPWQSCKPGKFQFSIFKFGFRPLFVVVSVMVLSAVKIFARLPSQFLKII